MTEAMPTVLPEAPPPRDNAVVEGMMTPTFPSAEERPESDYERRESALTKEDVCRRIYDVVAERGLPQQLAVGMCANAGAESLYTVTGRQGSRKAGSPVEQPQLSHPDKTTSEYVGYNKAGTGYGLWQLDAEKKLIFKAWADKKGQNYGLDSQINFVLDDITASIDKDVIESVTGVKQNDGSVMGARNGKDLIEAIKNSTKESAIAGFAQNYEKPGNFDNRERRRRIGFALMPEDVGLESSGPISIVERIRRVFNKYGQVINFDPYP